MALISVASCVKSEDYDFNNLEEAKWSPTYALPIASGELGFQDLLNAEDSATLGVREDDVFFFKYQDRFESAALAENIEIENVYFSNSQKTPVDIEVPANSKYRLPEMEGEIFLDGEIQLRTMDYKDGQFQYSIMSSFGLPLEVNFQFPSITNSEQELGANVEVSNQEADGLVELAGFTADLTTGSEKYNSIPFTIEIFAVNNTNSSKTIRKGESLTAEFVLKEQDFTRLEGFFGNLNVQLPEMVLPLGPFDEMLKYDMQLAEMDMKINIHNEYGVPISLSFPQFQALNSNGQALDIETAPNDPILLAAAENEGDQTTTSIEVVNGNELISHDPEEIRLTAHAALNEGESEGSNFILDDNQLIFDLSAEIPLVGSFRDFEIRDTVDADLRNSFDELEIKRVELNPELVNEFPLEGHFQIYMLDENQQVLDSLLLPGQTDIIRAGTVDAQGNLDTPGVYDEIIQISDEKFNALEKTTHLVLSAKLNTIRDAEGNSPAVRFKSQYKLSVELGALAELEATIAP